MDKYKVKDDFFYIDKYSKLFTIILLIYILIKLLLYKITFIVDTILILSFLIGAVCVLLLISATYNIYKGNILILLFFMHLYISCDSIFRLLPVYNYGNLYIKSTSVEYILSIMVNLMILYLLSKYSFDKTIKSTSIVFYVFILLVSILLLDRFIDKYIFTLIIFLGIIIYFIFTQKHLLRFKLIKEDNLNFMKFLSIVIFFLSLIYLIMNYYDIYIGVFREVFLAFVYTIYLSQFIVLIEKLLTRPYTILFDDLVKRNITMTKLNREIENKNIELEYSQMLVIRKEKMLKSFFSNVPIPLVIVNRDNNRISFSNQSFMNEIGEHHFKKVINRKLSSIIKIHKLPFDIKKHDNGFLRGTVRVNNEIKYFDMEFVDIYNNSNEVIVILYDVTSNIKLDSMRESVKHKLFEEGLKREFLSNISHDLKTPINVIYSASQLVKFYIDEGDKAGLRKYNDISKQNCITLIRLTNNLIDSSRIYSDFLSANMKVRNIVEVIEEIIASLIDYVKNNEIDLIFDTNNEEIFVELDEEFMQRIIMNLVSNALKFTNINGKIEITINEINEDVIIIVSDNGKGMDDEFLTNAFNKYATGQNNDETYKKGSGIGLFVVKNLVEKQNGNISVKSKKNKGTKFEMKFKKVLPI